MKDRPSRPRCQRGAFALIAGIGFLATPAFAGTSGSETLAPGEAKSVSTAPIYGTVRVCNRTTSKGTVTVTIGRESSVLSPGLCTEDSGGSVALANDHSGPAVIFYRSKRETNCPGHGG